MHQDDPGLEQRLSRFEAQLDRFSLALHQWQHSQSRASTESPADLDQRMRSLEETISRESLALRQLHEEPLKQLQGHAEHLTEISRSLQALLADLRLNAGPSGSTSTANWPLDRVVNLHDELRRTTGHGNGEGHEALPADTQQSLARRVHLLEAAREQDAAPHTVEPAKPRNGWVYAASTAGAILAILLVVVVVRWIESRLDEASNRVATAEQQVLTTTQKANQEVAAARQDADRQISEARQLAQRAETVGVILTAPDLIRFNLTSETNGSSAQLLWSRTRGLVLSGSRLPAAPPESTYQLWLVTNTQSIGAGLFVPDDAGRATLVVDAPPRVPGAVVGAAVTIEPSGGRTTPTGRTLLARFP